MTNINDQRHRSLVFTDDRDAFLERAFEAEDGCVSVGGMAHELGMLKPPAGEHLRKTTPDKGTSYKHERRMLSEFVELSRREQKLSVEAFANKANLGVEEVLQLEDPAAPSPEPRVIFEVARYLNADTKKLMELAGHTVSVDNTLEQEVIRIAACVSGSKPLDKDEQNMLRELAKLLLES